MALDLTLAATLTGIVNQNLPRKPWLANKFFGVKLHDTLQIGIDVIAGSKTLAPFKKAGEESSVVDAVSIETKWFGPNQIGLKVATTAFDMAKRAAGMQISYADGLKTIEERIAKKLGQDQIKLVNMIYGTVEKMCADALSTGTVTNYDKNGNAIETFSIGMDASHQITLSGTELWSNAASTPLENIDEWMQLISEDSGLGECAIVLGKNAAKALRTNSTVLEQLKANNSLYANVKPEMPKDGAQFIGFTGAGNEIWVCTETYTDSTGTAQPMIPVDKAIVIGKGIAADVHYGMIEDRKAGNFVGEVFSKTWEQEDPSVQWLKCASAPLAYVAQASGLVFATVL